MKSKVEAVKSIDWNSWFYNPGMPPYKVIYGQKFIKVYLGDSDRQPQLSRENLECYPQTNPKDRQTEKGNRRKRKTG